MIAELLQTFAEDFAAEYDEYRIPTLFDSTISILNGRTAQGAAGYATQINPIREKCSQIIETSRFNDYPAAWFGEIERSSYARYLPARAAQIILDALPTDFNIAPPSPPIALYQQAAMQARHGVEAYRAFSRGFNLQRIVVPQGKAGVIVTLPKVVFAKDVKLYGDTIARFADVAACIAEITRGERIEPELLYTSSSELVATLLVYKEQIAPYVEIYAAILTTIQLIKDTREAIKKFPEFLKANKEPDVRVELKKRVEPVLGSLMFSVPERREHLSGKLVSSAAELVDPIQQGARVSVAVDGKEQATVEFPKSDGSKESLQERMQAIRRLEADLPVVSTHSVKEAPAPALLTHQPPPANE